MVIRHGRGRAWTPGEHNFLVANYGLMTGYEIARQLNRTVSSVVSHALYHGISAIDNRRAAGQLVCQRPQTDRHRNPSKHADQCLARYHAHKHEPEYQERRKAARKRYRAKRNEERKALLIELGRVGVAREKKALRGYYEHLEIGKEWVA